MCVPNAAQLIAQKHYWQVTDSDFERAATEIVITAETRMQKAVQWMTKTRYKISLSD